VVHIDYSTMPRRRRFQTLRHKNAHLSGEKSAQLSLNPWLTSTREGVTGHLSAIVVCCWRGWCCDDWQSRNITSPRYQGRIPAIIPNPSNEFSDIECDVQLVTKVRHTDRTTSEATQPTPMAQVVQAQKIIANVKNKTEDQQKKAIFDSIQLLYSYAPRDGRLDFLRHLIYRREDLILIAKSMILQAVSVLINESISIMILPLDQIGQQQASYIEQIGDRGTALFLKR
jgi:hypothetical protein